jgi:histone H3/H4
MLKPKLYIPLYSNQIYRYLPEVVSMDGLVVKAKIKEVCKDFNVAGDVADALNEKVEQLLKEALKRAESNNRKTVMAKDI